MAMLVVKNKSSSLLWQLNSVFLKNSAKKCHCIDHHYGRHVRWLETKNNATFQCVGC